MRAQVAIEFLLVAGIASLILVGLLTTLLHSQSQATSEATNQALSNAADRLQEEFLLAAQVRDGYQRTFTLPARVAGQDYTVSQTNNSITLQAHPWTQSRQTPAFQGTINPPQVTITKQAGVISVS